MELSTFTKLEQERSAASWNDVWQIWRSCQFRTRFWVTWHLSNTSQFRKMT